ncbi:hypothetical protein AMTR_s00057p00106670 [Amborella trichopoda]|uniref:Uncharacterized protein n=1 Tax=Amborella trichopoda TaxID=13333 RepID=U5D8V0_AMBTC|nr:hypothetical protein AMTR_s00057p00106670 [Amborella trichopoda]
MAVLAGIQAILASVAYFGIPILYGDSILCFTGHIGIVDASLTELFFAVYLPSMETEGLWFFIGGDYLSIIRWVFKAAPCYWRLDNIFGLTFHHHEGLVVSVQLA